MNESISYTKIHPWRFDKTASTLVNKIPSLCVVKKRKSTTQAHQEGKGKELDHCLAENESEK